MDLDQDKRGAVGDELQLMSHQIGLCPFDVADQGEAVEGRLGRRSDQE